MERPLKLLIVAALALVLWMFGWWASREANLRSAQWKYSREFKPGMGRRVIENRLLSEGIRFFPESSNADFVSVGEEVRYSLVCAPREVGLRLEFKGHDAAYSGDEVLRSVSAVRQERGCL